VRDLRGDTPRRSPIPAVIHHGISTAPTPRNVSGDGWYAIRNSAAATAARHATPPIV
jgi:hypothetical protein